MPKLENGTFVMHIKSRQIGQIYSADRDRLYGYANYRIRLMNPTRTTRNAVWAQNKVKAITQAEAQAVAESQVIPQPCETVLRRVNPLENPFTNGENISAAFWREAA